MNNNQTITNYCNFLTFIIYFMIALIPIQMVLFALFPHPSTIVGWFSLFRDSPVVGFIGFDIFYIFSNILMIFFYISLLIVLKDKITNQLIFALILSFISITIYFSSNRAMEMFNIANKYFEATTETQKISFIAAGELLLSVYQGTAYFIYYVLNGLSLILLFNSFKHIDIFSKRTIVAGLISGFLMLIPATVGIIGMIVSLTSLIPWIITCIFLANDIIKFRNLTTAST